MQLTHPGGYTVSSVSLFVVIRWVLQDIGDADIIHTYIHTCHKKFLTITKVGGALQSTHQHQIS